MGSGYSTWVVPKDRIRRFVDLLCSSRITSDSVLVLKWLWPEPREEYVPFRVDMERARCDQAVSVMACPREQFACLMGDLSHVHTFAQFASLGSDWATTYVAEEAIIGTLSRNLGLVLAVDIVEDDYWEYRLARGGDLVDQFCSNPTRCSEAHNAQRHHLRGNSAKLAACLASEDYLIAPYLVQVDKANLSEEAKAFPDDEVILADPQLAWRFLDRLGLNGKEEVVHIKRFRAHRLIRA